MGLFKTIAEGGQIWAHRVRMFKQVIRIAILLAFASGGLFFAYRMARVPSVHYKAAWYYAQAIIASSEEKIFVDSQFWSEIEHQNIPGREVLVNVEKLQKACSRRLAILWEWTKESFRRSASLSLSVFLASGGFFLVKGIRSRRKRHVDGQKTISSWRIALRLKFTGKASSIKLGALPLVKGTETRHILISGGTGSGKTNCFHTILPQIRRRHQRAVVVDTTGEFVAKYFREGKDVLFNPFDRRGVQWHPWCECRDSYDYKSLAQSFIPSSYSDEENFWRKAAQEVFCSALQLKAEERRISEVSQLLLYDSLSTLHASLQDTKAAAFLDTASEKTAGSIRAVAASFLECLELFQDTETPFSIRDWVTQETGDSWVFLSSTTAQRASLTSPISAWFSVAMRSLIQMEPDAKRRLWFIADELPSLNRLKDLETCLTESRKFGGCALLALQSPAQLEMIYGRDLAKIILGNCATRIAFSEHDPEIAARISKTFGQKEVKEFNEAISYGAHEMRDGVNLSLHSKVSPVVSATALQSLEPHEAFVKLPGNLPIAGIKLQYQEVVKVSEPFLERQ